MSRFAENYYGIVFGFRAKEPNKYIDSFERFIQIDDVTRELTAKRPPALGELKADDIVFFIGKILRIFNKLNEYVLTYHDGYKDPHCEYNGYHFHAVIKARCHPTRDARWGRECLDFCKSRKDLAFFACQAVNTVPALVRHILTRPRVLVMLKSETMEQYVEDMPDGGWEKKDERETGLEGNMKVKKNAAYYRIEWLENLMKTYRTPDFTTLKRRILQDPEMWSKYKQLQAAGGFDGAYKKAVENYRSEEAHKTWDMILDDPDPAWRNPGQHNLYTIKDSIELFEKWIDAQGFKKAEFVQDLYNVIMRVVPKINTFTLMGEHGCGKSYIMRSLVAWAKYFGEVRGDATYAFIWENCVDTSIIFIEELKVTRDTVDQVKLVFEGAPTQVHVKHHKDVFLLPTPVIITSNNLPWQWCTSDEGPLRARMYFRHCRQCPWLKEYKKFLNPLIWPLLFAELTTVDFTPTPKTQDMITDSQLLNINSQPCQSRESDVIFVCEEDSQNPCVSQSILKTCVKSEEEKQSTWEESAHAYEMSSQFPNTQWEKYKYNQEHGGDCTSTTGKRKSRCSDSCPGSPSSGRWSPDLFISSSQEQHSEFVSQKWQSAKKKQRLNPEDLRDGSLLQYNLQAYSPDCGCSENYQLMKQDHKEECIFRDHQKLLDNNMKLPRIYNCALLFKKIHY